MPVREQSDARRKASSDYHARRVEQGWKVKKAWISPEALEALAKLSAVYGSADAAINETLKEAAAKLDERP